mgnify:FL=1
MRRGTRATRELSIPDEVRVENPLHHFELDAMLCPVLFMEPHSLPGNAVYSHEFLRIGRMPCSSVIGP